MQIDEIIQLLKEKKCRMTTPRMEILKILIKHQSILLTAEDILKEVLLSDIDINLTTIYRNLELLESMNLLYTVNVDYKIRSYKLVCMDHHHHHITCTKCGQMIPIDFCPITDHLMDLAKDKGYTLTDHTLELFGLCNQCQNQLPNT